MPEIHLFQIYYSERTRLELDPGFIPLDYENGRPDWREHRPIRNYLLGSEVVADDYYAFLSPKFQQKTKLNSRFVRELIRNDQAGGDIYLFSPFFDQIAFYRNCIEQVVSRHRDADLQRKSLEWH